MPPPEHALPIEKLLRQREWVRKVAGALVYGDQDADDLAQEAWLAALEAPPPDESSPKGWLATVLRRTAARLGRRDLARFAREQRRVERRAVLAAEELVAQAELQERVARRVLALAEPYRETILLRFFQDLSLREIAQRAGAPLETIRSRLRRGLALLREGFEAHEAESWRSVLVPLAAVPVAKTAGALVGGILVMSKLKALVFLAVAALFGIGVWKVLDRAETPGTAPSTAPAPAAGVPASATPETPAPPARQGPLRPAPFVDRGDESAASAPAATAAARIEGEVLSVEGQPVEDAWVFAGDPAEASWLGDDRQAGLIRGFVENQPLPAGILTTRTKALGRFALDLPRPMLRLTVAARHPVHGLVFAFGVPVAAGTPRFVSLQFEPGVRIFGRVTDAADKPVSNVRVSIMGSKEGKSFTSFGSVASNAQGDYDTGPMPGVAFSLSVYQKGFYDVHQRVRDLKPGERERKIDLRLEVAPGLRGKLVLADGKPAEVARRLTALFGKQGPTERQRLALFGSYEDPASDPNFRSLGHDQGLVLEGEDAWEFTAGNRGTKYLSLWMGSANLGQVKLEGAAQGPDLVVDWSKAEAPKRNGALALAVTSSETKLPVSGYVAEVLGEEAAAQAFERYATSHRVKEADGRHRFDSVPEGSYRVSIKADGFADWKSTVEVKSDPETTSLAVELVPVSKSGATASISGVVRGPDGAGLGTVTLWLVPEKGGETRKTSSNSEGAFRFDKIVSASYLVIADGPAPLGPGWARATPAPDAEGLVVTCQAGVSIEVVPEGAGGPFSFKVIDAGGVAVFDDARGGYRRWGSSFTIVLAPGRYTLEASCPSYDVARVEFTAGAETRLKPTLTRAPK